MIKSIKEKENIIYIDLTGPEGNAFKLISLVDSLGKELKMTDFRIKCIKDEMMLSDYEMLVQTFDKWFGEYVVLYR